MAVATGRLTNYWTTRRFELKECLEQGTTLWESWIGTTDGLGIHGTIWTNEALSSLIWRSKPLVDWRCIWHWIRTNEYLREVQMNLWLQTKGVGVCGSTCVLYSSHWRDSTRRQSKLLTAMEATRQQLDLVQDRCDWSSLAEHVLYGRWYNGAIWNTGIVVLVILWALYSVVSLTCDWLINKPALEDIFGWKQAGDCRNVYVLTAGVGAQMNTSLILLLDRMNSVDNNEWNDLG